MNEVTNFGFYMFNKWNQEECMHVFGEWPGKHVWGKYTQYLQGNCDRLFFYMSLDVECRQKIVDRANELYKDY